MAVTKRKSNPECQCELCRIQRDIHSAPLSITQGKAFDRMWDRMELAETVLDLMKYRAEKDKEFNFLGDVWVKKEI